MMLTILELITSVLNYVLGIAFISNFYPFRNKLQVRIPICAAILIARSVLNVNVVYHLYYLKAILYVIPFILCTVILLKCDKFRFLLLNALCIAILYLAEIIGGLKCYTERAVDKHPKIWYNKINKTRKGKRL